MIAVDWGTTNRRAWRIGPDGTIEDHLEDDLGAVSIASGGHARAVAALRARLGDHLMLLAGMIGSDRGWREAPYVPCPAGVADVGGAILWVEPGRTGIVPGLCQREDHPDVMRGEEVQVFGAAALGQLPPDALVCHPGTHAKWIGMVQERIEWFTTIMTGELFALLGEHSTLGSQMGGDPADGPAFRAGVADALEGRPIAAALFGVRARHLLGGEPSDGASYASGLLIGADVDAGLRLGPQGAETALIGRPDLCALYAVAINLAGRRSRQIDGNAAFLAGIAALAKHLA